MIAYTCKQTEPALWTTGYTDPAGKFHPDSDHGSRVRGFQRAAWLNGNNGEGYVYMRTEPGLWTTGYYGEKTGRWYPESDHDSSEEAARKVAEMNGSDPSAWTEG